MYGSSRRDLLKSENPNIHTLVSLLAKVTKVVFVCLFCLSYNSKSSEKGIFILPQEEFSNFIECYKLF